MSKAIGMTFVEGVLTYFAVVNGVAFGGYSEPDGLRKALAEAGAIEMIGLLEQNANEEFLAKLAALEEKSAVLVSLDPQTSKPYSYVDGKGVRQPTQYESLNGLLDDLVADQPAPIDP